MLNIIILLQKYAILGENAALLQMIYLCIANDISLYKYPTNNRMLIQSYIICSKKKVSEYDKKIPQSQTAD